ncbi:MAG: MFS transporter [Mucinivorans sp.]
MMEQQKPINYTGPFLTMVFLFFIVGFLTVVNAQFQDPLKNALLKGAGDLQNTLATVITFAWFLSYPLTGGIAARLVNKFGYKKTMVRGLLVMIAGLAVFECSVLFQEYNGATITIGSAELPIAYFIFIIGSYVVGAAVTIMQVVINPYLVACNVKGTSDVQRQNIGGSSNSIASTLAPFLVGGVIFAGIAPADITLNKLIIPFLGLIVVIGIVTFIVNRIALPNIAGTTNEGNVKLERSIWSFRHLTLGVVAIFMYVGVEVAVGANIVMNAKELGGTFAENAAIMASLYFLGMLIGRLVGASLSKVDAKIQLTVTAIAAAILVTVAMFTNDLWLLVGIGLFHSVMWPATFALAVRGLGKYTSAGSGALMIGVLGGGVLPLIQSAMADSMGGDWQWTWAIVLVGELYMLYYALIGCKVAKSDDMTKQ